MAIYHLSSVAPSFQVDRTGLAAGYGHCSGSKQTTTPLSDVSNQNHLASRQVRQQIHFSMLMYEMVIILSLISYFVIYLVRNLRHIFLLSSRWTRLLNHSMRTVIHYLIQKPSQVIYMLLSFEYKSEFKLITNPFVLALSIKVSWRSSVMIVWLLFEFIWVEHIYNFVL